MAALTAVHTLLCMVSKGTLANKGSRRVLGHLVGAVWRAALFTDTMWARCSTYVWATMMMVCIAGFCIIFAVVSDTKSCRTFFQTP